jgi:ArsR family transcriptional regulator
MMISPTLVQEISRMEADLCSAFVDPTRILILYTLNGSPRTVGELANELQITQPATSRHLKVLRDRGLVTSLRQGTSIEYRLADQRLIDALDILRAVLRDRVAHHAAVMEQVGSPHAATPPVSDF